MRFFMADSPLFISLFGFALAKSIHIIWGGGLCPQEVRDEKDGICGVAGCGDWSGLVAAAADTVPQRVSPNASLTHVFSPIYAGQQDFPKTSVTAFLYDK